MDKRAQQRPPTQLGQLLKALRTKHRYSLRALADEAGVSRNHIWRIEQGYDKDTGKPIKPHPDILRRLGGVLGDSYDALMIAASYSAEDAAAAVAHTETKRRLPERESLSPEVVDELKEKMAEAMMEVLRKRGFIK